MKETSRFLTASILSMSLLTVMAGAAVAPALGIIKTHFNGAESWQVQFIISLPALLIIITNLLFPALCQMVKTRTMAIIGLVMYVVCGSLPFLMDSIWLILLFRALLGVSVGLIMPLSTGLLSYYFPPEEQGRLMGLSAAMNQMGGVVATLLAGILANVEWNYTFLVYLLGLIAVVLVICFLPNISLAAPAHIDSCTPSLLSRLRRFHPSVMGMFLCMSLFFVYPSNFAIIAEQQAGLSLNAVTIIMVLLDLVAFFVGIAFGWLMRNFRTSLKYFAPVGFIIAYSMLSASNRVWVMLVASFIIGIANGIGIPYLNTIASIKGGKSAATTVMPLISASLYLGQFLSPIYISSFGFHLFNGQQDAPYRLAAIVAVIYLIQSFCTRNLQALPLADGSKK